MQAVLLGFSGVVVDDERIHFDLLNQLLVEDNLRPLSDRPRYRRDHLGQADAARFCQLWAEQGRILTAPQIAALLRRKQAAYQQALDQLPRLPLIEGLLPALEEVRRRGWRLGLVTGLAGEQAQHVLRRSQLSPLWDVVVTGDDLPLSSPEEAAIGYLHRLAAERLDTPPSESLGIEATYTGIAAGRSQGIPMLGLATLLPLHMLQRKADWVADTFDQIEWDRLASAPAVG